METTCKCCGITPPKTYKVKKEYICKPCIQYFVHNQPVSLANVEGGGEHASAKTTAMGTQAEHAFARSCCIQHMRFRPATKYENIVQHFDFVVEMEKDIFVKVEVKSVKSRRRGLPPDPRVIFVELKDIHGNAGWLYGKADLIAFQQLDGFVFVPRDRLVKFVEELRPQCRISLQSGVYHTLYSRSSRQDLIIVLDIEDILPLSVATKLGYKAIENIQSNVFRL